MRVLVTGAGGFIGSNLVEQLLKEGYDVVGIDINFANMLDKGILKNKKIYLYDCNHISKNLQLIYDDINHIDRYPFIFVNRPFDSIFHLAASADIRKSLTDTNIDIKHNVLGTHKILEIMRVYDIKKLMFSSSSSIYGETKTIPTPEDVKDIRPISLYGASKLADEAFINAYCNIYGFKAWVFRFANVVGKYQHRGVIVDFINKLNNNPKQLKILGNGKQTKSFFDVSDCIEGFMNIPKKDKNDSMEIYNLANIKTMTVKNLADIVCNEIGVSPKYIYSGGDRGWKGDTPYTILDIKKALKTGWKPKYSCEEAIKRTVRYVCDFK